MSEALVDSRARNDAARTILAIRDRYSEDQDRIMTAEPHLMLDEYQWKLAWLIRELNRAAEWARTGQDPGDGFSGSARRALDADPRRAPREHHRPDPAHPHRRDGA